MRPPPLLVLVVVPLLFSCLPKKTEVPGAEVPAGPLVRALTLRSRSFAGLTAVARVDVVLRGKKRSYDTVGIALDSRCRFRVEAFGPLGQSFFALVWDGAEVLMRLPDEEQVRKPGLAGIEGMLGMSIEPRDLCAILSATLPEPGSPSDALAWCTPKGACVVDLPQGEMVRRVRMLPPPPGPDEAVRIASLELSRSERLLYRARYERMQEVAAFLAPRTIVIESPGKDVRITIEYTDLEVNVPISGDVFSL